MTARKAHPETKPYLSVLLVVTVITNMLHDLRFRSGAVQPLNTLFTGKRNIKHRMEDTFYFLPSQ